MLNMRFNEMLNGNEANTCFIMRINVLLVNRILDGPISLSFYYYYYFFFSLP